MRFPPEMESYLEHLSPEMLRSAWESLLPKSAPREAKIAAIEGALNGAGGQKVREAAGAWIVEHAVPAKHLVPGVHSRWVPVVRAAMLYVVYNLSSARLAPKLLEQLELPQRTHPETRLLKLISKVPGLQKLGQVLARNRHLRPSLRRALSILENGIRDVDPGEVCNQIKAELGPLVSDFAVRIRPTLLSEASVSAVLRFTWKNPETGRRERGVFKVLKPYIPGFFAEDMDMLHGLADFFASKLHDYGLSGDVLSDTFSKVRLLLQHEVDFAGEQTTLRTKCDRYRAMSGIRVPRLIEPLCTPTITAMTEEFGVKIASAMSGRSKRNRERVSERILEALVVLPLFSAEDDVVFHADPHAGNLLYDHVTGKLAILDWALTERLTREQRRHLGMLFGFVALRDSVAAAREIEALRQQDGRNGIANGPFVRQEVQQFIDELPFAKLPNATDSMRLLEMLAMKGVRFPSSLIMLSKVMLTLDGILYDLGSTTGLGYPVLRHLTRKLLLDRNSLKLPLTLQDLLQLNVSSTLYVAKGAIRLEEMVVKGLLARRPEPVLS